MTKMTKNTFIELLFDCQYTRLVELGYDVQESEIAAVRHKIDPSLIEEDAEIPFLIVIPEGVREGCMSFKEQLRRAVQSRVLGKQLRSSVGHLKLIDQRKISPYLIYSVRMDFIKNGRPLKLAEGIALVTQYPQIAKKYLEKGNLRLEGSKYEQYVSEWNADWFDMFPPGAGIVKEVIQDYIPCIGYSAGQISLYAISLSDHFKTSSGWFSSAPTITPYGIIKD